ncbi:MAG: DUF192 domain-containing protein [Verrucomicrobiota bacterium]|nr:DUF192 domain-containing protein [Verrucomicrobiota bacterium]
MMKVSAFVCGILLFVGLGTGCGEAASPAASEVQKSLPASPPAEKTLAFTPTKAQPKLSTVKLWLGKEELIAEIAVSLEEISTGMMFRTNILESEAMLFIFARPHQASFWMRNVDIPLSCAYIDSEGTILEIHDMKPHEETPIVASTDQVRYVLETKHGWFERHQIKPGTVIRTDRGTLAQRFNQKP